MSFSAQNLDNNRNLTKNSGEFQSQNSKNENDVDKEESDGVKNASHSGNFLPESEPV